MFAKDLLIKGMLGAGLCVGTGVAGICYREDIKRLINSKALDKETILDKVGLNCDEKDGKNECTLKEGKKITIKQGDESKFEVSTAFPTTTESGKIKINRKKENDQETIEFSIEGGDISLTSSEKNKKLEEFETYEIKEETAEGTDKGKHYFSRKTKAIEGKAKALGLSDDCKLPDGEETKECTETTAEKLNLLNFGGKGDKETVTITNSGKAKITIAKATGDQATDFPHGFKVSIEATSGDISIPQGNGAAIEIKSGKIVDFKIKKDKTNLTLEKAWSLEKLMEKVGLEKCTVGGSGNECSIKENKLNIKQDQTTLENKSKSSSSQGKIKLYSSEEYNQGFKFVIEEGDISVDSNKLEEFETYEIKEDKGKWYLTRKGKADDEKRRILGLKDAGCELPTDNNSPKTCSSIADDKLKKINFEGKGTQQATVNSGASLQLTISKTSDTTSFPLGYKFVFKSTGGDSTIPAANSQSTTLKDGTNFDYKIKKNGTILTLEKAWGLKDLGEKAGLECANDEATECSIKTSGGANVKQDTTKLESKTKKSGDGKIKVYKNDEGKGYENGFKFVIEEADITLNNGSPDKKLEEFETYEIKEDSGKYYLTRKTKAVDGIKKALGLPSNCEFPTASGDSKECTDLDKDKLKTINFEGKKEGGDVTFEDSGTKKKIKISKETDTTNYPFGYKFTFDVDKDISIPKDGSTKIEIKKNTNTEFKIKKDDKNKTKLTLEKVWDVTKLAEKAGLKECSGKECSFNDGSINVHNGNGNKVECAKLKDNGNTKKIKYEEDQDGHNQGIKFYVEGNEDINLTCGDGNSDSNVKIEKQGDSTPKTSYEIKEEGGKWYLYKKTSTTAR